MTITHATSYFDGDISHGFGVELTTYAADGHVLNIEWLAAEGVSVIEPIDWTSDYAEELLRQSGWRCASEWEAITDPRDGAPGCHAVVVKEQAVEALAVGR
ncbi:hypothetical protein GS966_28615 [Rhodococcus hoagii]|nr:hypothetical protein [Prescottella equi]NKS10251.1 hypothetical protein [Prescottella equi]NKS35242.1 hypothetical protein [Prescottella equi]NKS68241.1 hypothetical protein [Prescottella equi]NKW53057.1 hypothetical protein [Prescottella equi]